MTNAGARPTKNQRREAAREKARQMREQQRKRERRNKVLLQGGIMLGVLAFAGVVALVIVNSVRPPHPGPKNMIAAGITITEGFEAVRTPALKADEDPKPIAQVLTESEDKIDIQIYLDYFCPVCGAFEAANAEQIETWIESGAITYTVHPVAFLDRLSLGTRYASRAANAAACVAEYAPDDYWAFNAAMFENQPPEQTEGLSNEEIVDAVRGAGVSNMDDIEQCINDEEFRSWVEDMRAYAINSGVPGTDINTIRGTPTVVVNGQLFPGPFNDANAFAAFVAQAEGQQFNESATPTPTPEPES